MVLNAGHVTSADMIPNGFNALLRHPEQFQKLKDLSTVLRRMPKLRAAPDKLASARRISLAFKGFDSPPVTF